MARRKYSKAIKSSKSGGKKSGITKAKMKAFVQALKPSEEE